MPLLSHANSTTVPSWHWGNMFAPLAFWWGFYSSETLLGNISLGYFWKMALIFFTGCSYSCKTFERSLWFSGRLFICSWPKIARTRRGAENTGILLEMGAIGSLGKLSPIVDNHTFPEFLWKLVNYLTFSPTPTGLDGVFENFNCKANIPSKCSYTKACP